MLFSLTVLAAGAAEAAKGGLPQLHAPDFAPQLIWLMITFGALYVLMSRVALPGIAEVLDERQNRIQRDLGEAERLKSETERALAAYEQALAEARAKAQTIARDTRDKLASEVDEERRRVETVIAAKLVEAERRVGETKSAALARVNDVAAETVGAIVNKVSGLEITADEVRSALASRT
ncbi:MAG: F0F1 ATP synthase subunit B' [Hyphomicrobiaceae bacterium]